MPLRSSLVLAAALVLTHSACGGSPAGPATTPPAASPPAAPVGVAGTWSGTGVDSQGATTVSWTLTQTGAEVSGTVKTQAIDPSDGSCNSCHRNKSGTFSGTLADGRLTMTMFFAAGIDGDPTPACSATLTGAASNITGELLATYAGADTCEGPFTNGTLAMTRR